MKLVEEYRHGTRVVLDTFRQIFETIEKKQNLRVAPPIEPVSLINQSSKLGLSDVVVQDLIE